MKRCKITKTHAVHLPGMSRTALRKNASCHRSTHSLHCRLGGGVTLQAWSPVPSSLTPQVFLHISLASWLQASKNGRKKYITLIKRIHSAASRYFIPFALHSYFNRKIKEGLFHKVWEKMTRPYEGKKLEGVRVFVMKTICSRKIVTLIKCIYVPSTRHTLFHLLQIHIAPRCRHLISLL